MQKKPIKWWQHLSLVFLFFLSTTLFAAPREKITHVSSVEMIPVEIRLSVDYRKTRDELIALGNFNWVSGALRETLVITREEKNKEIVVALFPALRNISSAHAVKEMTKRGFRPAYPVELLAYAAKFPLARWEFPIAALGLSEDPRADSRVLLILGDGVGRGLDFGVWGGGWFPYCQFLMVKSEKELLSP